MASDDTPAGARDDDALKRTADVLRGDDRRSKDEVDRAQDELDSRLEREGADQSSTGRG